MPLPADITALLARLDSASDAEVYPAVDRLRELVRHGPDPVREEAIAALITIGGDRSVKAGIRLLDDSQEEVVAAAERLLVAAVDAATLPLVTRVAEIYRNLAKGNAAARVLAALGGAMAESFGTVAAVHHRARVRRRALVALQSCTSAGARKTLWSLAEDRDAGVRNAALDVLIAQGVSVHGWAVANSVHADIERRRRAARILAIEQSNESVTALFPLLGDTDEEVRSAASAGVRHLSPAALEQIGVEEITASEASLRRAACRILGLSHAVARVELVAVALADDDKEVRREALEALASLDPERAAAYALSQIQIGAAVDVSERITAVAVLERIWSGDIRALHALLAAALDPDQNLRFAVGSALAEYDHPSAATMVVLAQLDPRSRRPGPLSRARAAKDTKPVVAHLQNLGISPDAVNPKWLHPSNAEARRLLADSMPTLMAWIDDARRAGTTVPTRRLAAAALGFVSGPTVLDRLMQLADDDSSDVRGAALESLGYQTARPAAHRIILALFDPDKSVADAAEATLNLAHSYPALKELLREKGRGFWRIEQNKIDELLQWSQATAQSFLGQAVHVSLRLEGTGATAYAREHRDTPSIELNPQPLLVSEYGVDVVKGVLLHELGHHAYDFRAPGFKSANGMAIAAGARSIFDLLIDERLERRLRGVNPEWGQLVDRMNASLIETPPVTVKISELAAAIGETVETTRARIQAGALPGEMTAKGVRIRPINLVQIPGVVPPYLSFLLAMMAVRDPRLIADKATRKALDLIPTDLKDIPHGEVARLAIEIARILGVNDDGRAQRKRFARFLSGKPGMSAMAGALSARMAGRLGRRVTGAGMMPAGRSTGVALTLPVMSTQAPTSVASGRYRPQLGAKGAGGQFHNLSEDLSFNPFEKFEQLVFNEDAHTQLRAEVRPHARRLRRTFEWLGIAEREEFFSRRGGRIDVAAARSAPVTGSPNILVHSYEEPAASAFVGLLIDRSGSMSGAKIELAKRFGVLLAESARGIRGITGHVCAFDDDTYFQLGDLQHHTIASLQSGGGNNDCAALYHAAHLALRSRRKHRLLIMISDGSPTQCSQQALTELVASLTRNNGIRCAQVAVAPLEHQAFRDYLDVSSLPIGEATRRFARLLGHLTRDWR